MSCSSQPRRPRGELRSQRGVTLPDVLLSIVLLGIAAAALTTAASRLAAQSADATALRQADVLAQGLLDAVRQQPATYCVVATGVCNLAPLINVPALPATACTATGRVAPQALPGIAALDGSGQPQVLHVVVTVNCPGATNVVAEGLRVRYAAGAF